MSLSMKQMQQVHQDGEEFFYRLDFYWQAVAIYAVAIVVYALVRGTIESKNLTLALDDPVVILLVCIIIFSASTLLVNWYMRRSIVIGPGFIRFKNRLRERTFTIGQVKSISIGRYRRSKVRGTAKVVRIRLQQRRLPLRIRPSLYDREEELTRAIIHLKKSLSA